ncbi:Protein of unknown function [Gracilibacillus ureilyticus]|uniref:DUF2487 domain-containing protein n=1 Tax=Gracilibacillus ureilyticus TaxID=531814 RepID=A0A1H9LNQ2_9BACI|nr:DUF2487 family protein [Gracilibacillus ureilyticus]SER13046.1 Protein of unknown function [Gracilibacillus ureilyticus]
MKWDTIDLKTYFKSKEYVDTVCIPLVPLNLSNETDAIKFANYQQTIQIIAKEVERNFTGRVLLSPVYTYFSEGSYEAEQERINQWTELMFGEDFKHKFFLTFDLKWKKEEKGLDGTLLWLPASMIEDYQSEVTKKWIMDQKSQVSELIRSFWQ